MVKLVKAVFLFFVIVLFIAACSNSTEPQTNGSLSLSSKYSTAALLKQNNINAIEINVTKVTYILREIKFKTQKDSTEGLYKTTPLILEMNLAGNVQEVGLINVPFGTYNRLEFDIHRVEANDTTAMTLDQRIKIRPFFQGDKYSIIIEGIVKDGASQKNFIYKSRINAKQKIDLAQTVVVSETENNVNATMLISSFGWFKDGSIVLDPTDSKNESKIDNNIRASIKAVKDKNKDGNPD